MNRSLLCGLAAVASIALSGTAVQANSLPFTCAAINAENIANGTANEQGYTIGAANSSGVWSGAPTNFVLPDNGIICVKTISFVNGPIGSLTFTRNGANTPAYVLAEDGISFGTWRLDVSGKAGLNSASYGVSHLGGQGGPAAGDGGSCDNLFSSPHRSGPGGGPAGGRGRSNVAAGGGGSAILNGGGASNGSSADGGTAAWTNADSFYLFGGSGGGCGVAAPGGGGGGVIVVATNGTLNLGVTSNGGIRAVGGWAGSVGGGGGGGIVRIVAGDVTGNGIIDVRGGGVGASCGTSGVGGCGGNGLVRIETPTDDGIFTPKVAPGVISSILSTNGQASVRFGVVRDILPPPGLRPTVRIVSVTSDLGNGPIEQPVPPANDAHVYRRAGVVLPSSGALTVKVETFNVPETAVLQVRLFGPQASTQTVVQATQAANPTGTGPMRLWTATFPSIINTTTGIIGSIEAHIVSPICTPGSPGCPPVE